MKKFKTIGSFIFTFSLFTQAGNTEEIKLRDNFLEADRPEMTVINNQNGLKVNFDFTSINHEESAEGELLTFKGLPLTNEISGAQVPFKAFILKGRAEDLKVEISRDGEVELGDFKLSAYLPKPCRCNDVLENNFDKSVYEQSAPTSNYKLENLGDYKGEPLTRLLVFPLEVKLNKAGRFDVQAFSSLQVKVNANLFNHVDEAPAHLVIVGPRALLSGAETFANYKRQNGFQVTLKSFEDVGGNKEGLAQYFRSFTFTHAMILGHERLVETFNLFTQFEQETPSDLPYFTFGGEEDTIADVFHSRVSASSAAEVKLILQKGLEFEKISRQDVKNSQGMIGIASNEGLNPTDVQYLEGMMAPLEEIFSMKGPRFHQANNSTPEGFNQALNLGAYWLSYIGHGSGFSWPSFGSRPYEVSDISQVKEAKVLPMLVDVACQNGRFEGNGRLGEAFMLATKNGKSSGVRAYYGGTVNISWDPPAIMAQGISRFVNGVFKNKNEKKVSVSEALWAGQLYLMENYSEKNASKENRIWYHLQGDPTMPLAGNTF